MSWILSVDFGTTFTSAAMAYDGKIELVEVDGKSRVPSTVFLNDDGELVVGVAAENQAALDLERVERTPKRSLGEPAPLLLGGQAVRVADAVGQIIKLFVDEATRLRGGEPPSEVRLTHPANWQRHRLSALVDAAGVAGLKSVTLIPEPVAAAVHFAGSAVAPGAYVAVYDLGGGTFDTAVLRRTQWGFEVIGNPGGTDPLGGETFDHIVYQRLGRALGATKPEEWNQMSNSSQRTWRKAASDFLSEVRRVKEGLSRAETFTLYLGAPVDHDLRLNRDEFEDLIRADVDSSVAELIRTIEAAGLKPPDLAGVYLAGGSSRIPLVARAVGDALGQVPKVLDEPKTVVALGAARADGMGTVWQVGAGAASSSDQSDESTLIVESAREHGAASSDIVCNNCGATANGAGDTVCAFCRKALVPAAGDRAATRTAETATVEKTAVAAVAGAPQIVVPAVEPNPRAKVLSAAGIGAVVLLIAAIGVVALKPKPADATELKFDNDKLASGLRLAQVWRLEGNGGGQFVGTISFSNPTSKAITDEYVLEVPKSLADHVDDITFTHTGAVERRVINPDPVIAFDVTVPSNGATEIEYRVKVPEEGVKKGRLEAWKKAGEKTKDETPADGTTTTTGAGAGPTDTTAPAGPATPNGGAPTDTQGKTTPPANPRERRTPDTSPPYVPPAPPGAPDTTATTQRPTAAPVAVYDEFTISWDEYVKCGETKCWVDLQVFSNDTASSTISYVSHTKASHGDAYYGEKTGAPYDRCDQLDYCIVYYPHHSPSQYGGTFRDEFTYTIQDQQGRKSTGRVVINMTY